MPGIPEPMAQRIHFNSSLPRSGSTLLQNLLAQNPRFHCSPTSGVFELLAHARVAYTEVAEFRAQDREATRAAFLGFCRGALAGYYAAATDRPVCVDKGRSWLNHHDWLSAFHPDPKILVCVRDLRAILASMEKLFRKNRHLQDRDDLQPQMKMITLHQRVAHWLNSAPVGIGVMRVVDAILTGVIRKVHVVRFEDLTQRPQAVLDGIYAYLGEERFVHDTRNVVQVTEENDAHHGLYGEHRIRREVAPVEPDYVEVLGREVCDTVRQDNALFYDAFYRDRR